MPADPDLMEEVYAFARARAVEATQQRGMDEDARRWATSHLRWLQTAYADAKQFPSNAAVSAAIDVFREAAMQNRDYRGYDHIWTLPESSRASAIGPGDPLWARSPANRSEGAGVPTAMAVGGSTRVPPVGTRTREVQRTTACLG